MLKRVAAGALLQILLINEAEVTRRFQSPVRRGCDQVVAMRDRASVVKAQPLSVWHSLVKLFNQQAVPSSRLPAPCRC